MADFDEAVEIVFANEGGFNPDDEGAPANYGIRQAGAYADLDVKSLTPEEAKNIYFRDYWVPNCFTQILSQEIANRVFDFAVNAGPAAAIRALQQAVSMFVAGPIVPDGKLGPVTLGAINAVSEAKLLAEFRARRAYYHAQIAVNNPARKDFLLGWLRRDCQ